MIGARRGRVLAGVAVFALLFALASPATAAEPSGLLAGNVRGAEAAPIPAVHVYAYSLADFELRKVLTDLAGRFQFAGLPAGLYHIVAFKPGFLPAVVALTRQTADRDQTLDLHLLPEDPTEPRNGEDYWLARSRIPPDVLREIETQSSLEAAWADLDSVGGFNRFETKMLAETGVDGTAGQGDAQVTGGKVTFEGQLQHLDIGVEGDFRRLQQASQSTVGDLTIEGSASQVSFDLKSQGDARFSLTTERNKLVTRRDGVEEPVDFDHVRFDYMQPWGESAQSTISASVIDEANFYNDGAAVEPAGIPRASRTWQLEGSYSHEISDRTMVATGVRFRERQAELSLGPAMNSAFPAAGERVDIFGEGGYRVRPAMLIEYGVYTVLRDGNLALAPQGGLVLQLNPQWQLAGRASGSFSEQGEFEPPVGDFLPHPAPRLG